MNLYLPFLAVTGLLAYCFDRIRVLKTPVAYLIILFPCYFLLAIQNGVGTDYESYISLVEKPGSYIFQYEKSEYVFGTILYFIQNLGAPSQSIFFIYSALFLAITSIIFYRFSQTSKSGYLLIVTCYFLNSNIYFNQYNGIRIYLAAAFSCLVIIYLSRNERIKAFTAVSFAVASHGATKLIFALTLPTYMAAVLRRPFYIFLITPFIIELVFIPSLGLVLDLVAGPYRAYLESAYSSPVSVLNTITRMYELPILAYFLYKIQKAKESPKIIYVASVFVAIFCWNFLLMQSYGFFFRLDPFWKYFALLVTVYSLTNLIKSNLRRLLISAYLFSPGIAKLTIFARGEYFYSLG